MDVADLIFWSVALAAMVLAGYWDVKHRLIPNFLTLIVLCAALGLRVNGGLAAAALSLVATLIVAGFLYVIADRDYMGWGDAKMIAAASLLVPVPAVATLMVCIVLAGGLLSCLYFLGGMALRHSPQNCLAAAAASVSMGHGDLMQVELTRIAAREPMPYGIAILGGTLFWLLSWMVECSFATYC